MHSIELSLRELRFLEAIMDLLWQHAGDGDYDRENDAAPVYDMGLSANEDAICILKEYGLIKNRELFYKKLFSLLEEGRLHKDKRTAATGAFETLGKIIDGHHERGAINIAVEPVIAGQTLTPGMRVGIKHGMAFAEDYCDCALGIVDPFLEEVHVEQGQSFWLLVLPRPTEVDE